MEYYVISQYFSTGQGYKAVITLVVNPEIINGGIKATKVGELDWERTLNDASEGEGKKYFKRTQKGMFLAIGNATCEKVFGTNIFGDPGNNDTSDYYWEK
jgi:hypothetical protein